MTTTPTTDQAPARAALTRYAVTQAANLAEQVTETAKHDHQTRTLPPSALADALDAAAAALLEHASTARAEHIAAVVAELGR